MVPEAYTVIALVLHEMMTNSAKYGSLCDRKGSLLITTEIDEFGDLRIEWRERGGPPVKAPTRRGFGTTIIESSIPHELKGDAQIRYQLSGVEADFLIPSKYVRKCPGSGTDDRSRGEKTMADTGNKGIAPDEDAPVLLVEDSLIIAMDGEEMLYQLGFKDVRVCANVPAALDAIEEKAPRFGLLDYNLGDESSDEIAHRLDELDIPYWFVTGYGEAMEKLIDSRARGVLQKPYSPEDMKRAIASLND